MRRIVWLLAALGLTACADDDGDPEAGCVAALCEAADSSTDAGASEQPGDRDAGAAPGSRLLVGTDALADRRLTPVDARDAAAFAAGHIPGALSLAEALLRATVDGVPGQIPPAAEVARSFGQAGVARGAPLVVYGASSDLAAARLLWTFEHMGHAEARLLDGGYAAFLAAGLSPELGASQAAATSYPEDEVDPERRVDADWVLAQLDQPDTLLIDARSAAEHAAAHIPGALSFDWQQNLAEGKLLPRAELLARYADVPRNASVVAYCQTGSRASMTYFVLRYLGYPDVRLYDGSMADWTADPSRPLEP